MELILGKPNLLSNYSLLRAFIDSSSIVLSGMARNWMWISSIGSFMCVGLNCELLQLIRGIFNYNNNEYRLNDSWTQCLYCFSFQSRLDSFALVEKWREQTIPNDLTFSGIREYIQWIAALNLQTVVSSNHYINLNAHCNLQSYFMNNMYIWNTFLNICLRKYQKCSRQIIWAMIKEVR